MNRTSLTKSSSELQLGAAEIALAKKLFEEGNLLGSLRFFDKLNTGEARSPRPYLRALVRELVGDLKGSLEDLQREGTSSELVIARARVLAKLGFVDEAVQMIKGMLSGLDTAERRRCASASMGIGGRRFDLELLGARSVSSGRSAPFQEWERGCIVEHLMALGEFDECRKMAVALDATGNRLLSLLNDVESADELSEISARLPTSRVKQSIDGIRGWFSADEAAALSGLGAGVPSSEDIVEIGSFAGRSTCALALGATTGFSPAIHSVDTHSGLRGIFEGSTLALLKDNLRSRGAQEAVTELVATSTSAAKKWTGKRVGLLFVDGDHAYESVRNDLEAWYPHIASRGYLAFHDSNQSGPAKLLQEIITGFPELRSLGLRDSLFVLQRSAASRPRYHEAQKSHWPKYLNHLSEDYSSWLRSEKRRLRETVMGVFESLLQTTSSQEPPRSKAEKKDFGRQNLGFGFPFQRFPKGTSRWVTSVGIDLD